MTEPITKPAAPQFEIQDTAKKTWRITLHPDQAWFETAGEPPQPVPWQDRYRRIAVTPSMFGSQVTVKLREGVTLPLTSETLEPLAEWMRLGTPEAMRANLRKQLVLGLAIGAGLILLAFVPLDADPDAGLPPSAFDAISFFFGALLLLDTAVSGMFAHAACHVVGSVVWLAFAAGLSYRVVFEGFHPLWFLAVMFALAMSLDCLYRFAVYRRWSTTAA